MLPYVAAIGAVLLGFRWRELRGAAGGLLGVTVLVGAAPMLVHSLVAGQAPLDAMLSAGGADASAGWADRLHGGLVLGPPLGLGFCGPGRCATWQLWWALALPVLLAVAAVTAWRSSAHRRGPLHRRIRGSRGPCGWLSCWRRRPPSPRTP
ncbi:hypothetical protein GCM10027614_28240 [Micromonospora vulcania]